MLGAYNEYCPLIVRTASHRECIQTTDLLAFMFVQRLAIPILMSQERPYFDRTRRRQSQYNVVFK